MASKIQLKKSNVTGRIPDPADLDWGEIALNYLDGKLFYKQHGTGTVQVLNTDTNTVTRLRGNAGVTITGVFITQATNPGGQFGCDPTTLSVGDLVTISGTPGAGYIQNYTSPTTYKVSAVVGTSPNVTGFTLTTVDDIALTTSYGYTPNLTYTTGGTYTSGDLTLLAGTNVSIAQSGTDITISANAAAEDPTKLPLTGGTMTGAINMSGTQTISAGGYAGIEYYNEAGGQWQGYIGTESNSGNLRFNSYNGNHNWYSNSNSIATLNSTRLRLGAPAGSPAPAIVSNLNRYLEIAVNDANATSYPYGSGVVFHHGGISTSALSYIQPDANAGYFYFNSDDSAFAGTISAISMRAPIFYDSADAAYYLDPASGANGISLNVQGRIQVGTFNNSQVNTGEAWIGRASDRGVGTLTVQLGNDAARYFEVVDKDWTTVIFGVGMNTFGYKGNAVLHAGNYSSYALPLTGGTLTGTLTGASGTTLSFSGGSGAADSYNYVLAAANDAGNRLVVFVNGSARSADGGADSVTIRNDGGTLNLGNSSHVTNLVGSSVVTATAAAGTNTTQVATTQFVQTAIANLVDTAPSTLDTLNELAAALGDDPNFATTVTNSLANKLNLTGGTLTGALTLNDSLTLSAGTANGVAYLNGSKVLTTGSALTFDGTNFATTGDINSEGSEKYINFRSTYSVGSNVRARIRAVGAGGGSGYGGDFRVDTRAPNNTWNTDAFVIDSSGQPIWTFAGSEQMRLTSTGLGIGTSSPANKLDVSGAVKADQVKISTNTTDAVFAKDDNLTSWEYTGKSFSPAGQETSPTGMFFSPDGTRMYVIGSSGDDVNQYSLSTAWDVTTASFVRVSAAIGETAPTGVFFKPDGTVMYVTGTTNDTVREFSVSTAWDVSTIAFVRDFSVAAQDTAPSDIWFKPDGLKMYMVGTTNDRVYEYNLATAWDVSTASFVQFFSLAAQDTSPVAVNFTSDGTRMYVLGAVGLDINRYSLSTPWDISTAVFFNNFYIGFQEASPAGMFIDLSNDVAYVVGSSSDNIFQYSTKTDGIELASSSGLFISGSLYTNKNLVVTDSSRIDGQLRVAGAVTASSTLAVSSTLTASGSVTFSTATGTLSLGTSQTSGTTTIGGTTQTGIITLGRSTATNTINIGTGVTASGSTQTINVGTSGASGSITNINIGSSVSGSTGTVNIYSDTNVSGNLTLNSATENGVGYFNGSKVLTSGSALTFDGTDVGIGGAPVTGLPLRLLRTSSGAQIRYQNTAATWDSGVTAAGAYEIFSAANTSIQFGVNSSEQMRLDSTGLGIGTSSPAQKLHVSSASNDLTGLTLQNSSTNGRQYVLAAAGRDGYFDAPAGSFAIRDITGSVTRVILDSSGNLGIGTTAPGYKLEVNGSFAATTKSFVIDHPTKPGKKLRYGSLEGPENGVYVRGRLRGTKIQLPDYWTKLVDPDSITVQLTPVGRRQDVWVTKIENNCVHVQGTTQPDCYYFVQAERVDVAKLEVEIE